jgi:hypothetical protein
MVARKPGPAFSFSCFCFLIRNNGGNKNAAGKSASPPYRGGAFGGGSVRAREPRPEPMRRGVDQWKPGG